MTDARPPVGDTTQPEGEPMALTGFQQELEHLCNRYSVEHGSDTPDFVLAQFIVGCLEAWNGAVKRREKWYGREIGTENSQWAG
jgi:hypothetical protein